MLVLAGVGALGTVLACGDDEPEPIDTYVTRDSRLKDVQLRGLDVTVTHVDSRIEISVSVDHAGIDAGIPEGKVHVCPTFEELSLSIEAGDSVRTTPFFRRGTWGYSWRPERYYCEPPSTGIVFDSVARGEVAVVLVQDDSMTLRLELREAVWRRELELRDQGSWDFFAGELIVLRWSVMEDLTSMRPFGLRFYDRYGVESGNSALLPIAPDMFQGLAPTARLYGTGTYSLVLQRQGVPCEVVDAPVSGLGCRVIWGASFRRPGSLRPLP